MWIVRKELWLTTANQHDAISLHKLRISHSILLLLNIQVAIMDHIWIIIGCVYFLIDRRIERTKYLLQTPPSAY